MSPGIADPTAPFELFGAAHLAALGLLTALGGWLAFRPARRRPGPLAWTMALLLLAQEAIKLYAFIVVGGEPLAESLPLALCRVNEFLCVVVLLARSYRTFEIAYFWAMTGSVIALLTPDLQQNYPDPRFLLFFFGHGLVVLAVVYAMAAYGFRPTLRSVFLALAVTAAYTLVIAVVNLLLDSNYLFLREKPEGASVMDLFGPWPWYVLANALLAVVLCLLAYLPFPLLRRLSSTPRE